MSGEIELVSDGDGVVVIGRRSAIERYLDHAGLLPEADEFALGRLSNVLKAGADVAKTASGIAEQSARYLKLTPESAKRLRDAGGLMKTKTEGISHAMLGETGTKSLKWLQVEDGPASLLTNPAVLSGIGGLMSQCAQRREAHELKALLVRMDEKLDDVRRRQRDAVLAKMDRAAAAIEDAMTIHRHGGDPSTLWTKVSAEAGTILEVQSVALRELSALAEKVEGKSRTGELKRAAQETERETAIQLSILARCFELQDEFRVVELDHVLATAPMNLEGHRLGLAEARQARHAAVLERTQGLLQQMNAAGGIVNANIVLHARAARAVIESLNSTAAIVEDFHASLGFQFSRGSLSMIPWGDAIRDPRQLKRAGIEVSQKAVAGGAAAATVVAIGKLSSKIIPKG
ncbi:hypothetical protein [Streptomyces sp. NPDC018610]|uniref:hypothetical protein n=1 Tax=Streptomyces sp. NPDC018610 TaxID=3365049 RepID=UPI00378C787C